MATPAEMLSALRKTRVSNNLCTTPQDIAQTLDEFQQATENIVTNVYNEITNIINTGGGNVTAPVYIIRALVNQLGNVTGSQATFPFDTVSVLFSALGTNPVFNDTDNPPTAHNIQGRAFVDNEPVNLTSFNGTMWFADKLATNTIYAYVNEPGGVLTTDSFFNFDGAVAITGVIPPDASGEAINGQNAFNDNELIVLTQIDRSGRWAVVQDDDDLGGGTGGGVGSAGFGLELTGTTFSLTDNQLASEGFELLGAVSGIVEWGTVAEWLEGLADYNQSSDITQTIGHESPDDPKWFGMTSIAKGKAGGAVADTDSTFTGNNFITISGITPDATETVQNIFGFDLDGGADILVVRNWNTDTWQCINADFKPVTVITEITGLAVTGGNLVLTYKASSLKVAAVVDEPSTRTVTVPVTTCP